MTSLFREISDHALENAESQKHKSPDGDEPGHFLESQGQRLRLIEVLEKRCQL